MKPLYLVWLGVILLLVGCREAQVQADPAPQNISAELQGAVISPQRALADFTLPSTQGEFTLSDYRGKVVLLYFGYLSCPDVCPNTSAQLAHLLENLGEQGENVVVVFVTVDPERDQLETMTAYLQLFDERFIGIRTEGEALETLLAQFGAQASRETLEGSALAYTMNHTASVFLITPQGKLLEQFLFGTPLETWQHDVELILKEMQ